MKRVIWWPLSVFLVLAVSVPAWGSYVLHLSLEDLVDRADSVVRARVVDRESRLCDEGRQVYTYTTLEVLSSMKGPGRDTVVVRQLGGEVDGIGSLVGGDARFEVGEEVVVFLRDNPDGKPFLHMIGLSQGKFRVERSEDQVLAVRELSDLSLVRPRDGRLEPVDAPGVSTLNLEELEDAINAAVLGR